MISHFFKIIWNQRRKNTFLILELALSFLVVCGVFTFAFKQIKKLQVEDGFQTENIYVVSLSMQELENDSIVHHRTKERLKAEILALPEVKNASYSSEVTPYGDSRWITGNGDGDENGFAYKTDYILCDENYDEVWQPHFKEGKFFNTEDLIDKYTPIVVSQKFVDQFLKDTTALGFSFQMQDNNVKIVGILDHFKFQGKFEEEIPVALLPLSTQWENLSALTIAIQPGSAKTALKSIYDVVAKVTKNFDFKIKNIDMARRHKSKSGWIPIISLFCISLFLVINIAMGLFGILRYNISRRRPEIGLRKALGASAKYIRLQFMGEMMVITTMALSIGMIFAIQLPLLDVLLTDSMVYGWAILTSLVLIYGIVAICSFFPSHHAAQVEAATALHEE
ncbi:ABC transporter permease [Membranihabitans marinus]|uniref:ABC transporter permease n=1 Tax=Membranihabitans marinus TaxID=1227546 RepID=UPI001F1F9D57|nr:FtsX-like permease family protein [Membranihabitans marinus]